MFFCLCAKSAALCVTNKLRFSALGETSSSSVSLSFEESSIVELEMNDTVKTTKLDLSVTF